MRIIRQLIIQVLNGSFIFLLLTAGMVLYSLKIEGHFLFAALVLFIAAIFPLYIYYIERFYRKMLPFKYEDLYIQTVDMFLSLQTFDDVIKVIFDRVLHHIGVSSGLLLFYSHSSDDYTIYYQKQQKQKIIRKAQIDKNNIILKIIQSGDDILIKSKMDPSVHFQRTILFEMEKLGGEIIIPIYYHNIFLGIMIIGEMKMRISKRDVLMLKALASKIATVAANSFFVHELIKSKEIEKEYEIAYKVLQQFVPPDEGMIQKTRYTILRRADSEVKYFFNIYTIDSIDAYIIVCQLKANLSLLSMLIPAITVLLQSYARLHIEPDEILKKINAVLRQKELMEDNIAMALLKKTKNNYTVHLSNKSNFRIFVQKKSGAPLQCVKNGNVQIKNPAKLIITTSEDVETIAAIEGMPKNSSNSSIVDSLLKDDLLLILKE